MSDYISKDALLEIVGKMPLVWEYGKAVSDIYDIIKEQPTLDEKEIIRKTVERIVERLEDKLDKTDLQTHLYKLFVEGEQYAFDTAIEIVKEEGGIE